MIKPPQQESPLENVRRKPSRREVATLLSGLVAVVVFLTLSALRHPSEYGVIPPCPFRAGTGFYCPGCGSLRATHYLVTGRPGTSLRYNPLVASVLPLLVFSAIRRIGEVFAGKVLPFPCQSGVYWTVLIVFLVFFVSRNIPLELFDVLRPPAAGTR